MVALRILAGLVLVYLCMVGFILMIQRHLMYRPTTDLQSDPAQLGAQIVSYTTVDNIKLTSWYFPPKGDKPVFVMFHGNGGNVSWYHIVPEYFSKRGYGFLLTEYRGYGLNGGSPSEEGFYNDGRAAMNWLLHDQKIPENKIIIYGHSIGSGTSCQMAMEYKNIKALVLEAPFANMVTEVGDVYPWLLPFARLTWDKYDNIAKAPQLKMPVIVLNGAQDAVIPARRGKELFDALASPVKKYVLLNDGGHNNLADFGLFSNIENFVSSLKGT